MQAVAREAGVAVGTAYVHYGSKDELVIDAYRELKVALSARAVDGVDLGLPAPDRFLAIWHNIHRYLEEVPDRARFLLQVDTSPYAGPGHRAVLDRHPDDPLAAAMADVADRLVDLPPPVLFDLAIGPAIRLVASGLELTPEDLEGLARCCWRAVGVEGAGPEVQVSPPAARMP
jgi:AcrR family transcriptional regulator